LPGQGRAGAGAGAGRRRGGALTDLAGTGKTVKQDCPPLNGRKREHPRPDPGVIRELLPDGVVVGRPDDDQDLALALERPAEHDEPRADEAVDETGVIVKAGLPAQVTGPVPRSAPALAYHEELQAGVGPGSEVRNRIGIRISIGNRNGNGNGNGIGIGHEQIIAGTTGIPGAPHWPHWPPGRPAERRPADRPRRPAQPDRGNHQEADPAAMTRAAVPYRVNVSKYGKVYLK
jgi:hypothetical protein